MDSNNGAPPPEASQEPASKPPSEQPGHPLAAAAEPPRFGVPSPPAPVPPPESKPPAVPEAAVASEVPVARSPFAPSPAFARPVESAPSQPTASEPAAAASLPASAPPHGFAPAVSAPSLPADSTAPPKPPVPLADVAPAQSPFAPQKPEPSPTMASSNAPPKPPAPLTNVAPAQSPFAPQKPSPPPMAGRGNGSAFGPSGAFDRPGPPALGDRPPPPPPNRMPPGPPFDGPKLGQAPMGKPMHPGPPPPQHSRPPPPPMHAGPPGMPGEGPPANAAAAHMRELRVEDALLYLDDVKREFRNQPGVYNEFLTIMKNFKTQAVDTPGVIERVSKLFRGYNKLILGFNTFLPEGYKISAADLKRREAEMVAREKREEELRKLEAQKIAGMTSAPHPTPPKGLEGVGGALPPGFKGSPANKQGEIPAPRPSAGKPKKSTARTKKGPSPSHKKQQPAPLPSQQQPPVALGQPPQQPVHQAVEFDHAISYVTQIKRRFANDPNTYHSFLEILHTYQKEQRGIKEVLEQVTHLFQDHPDLLKEFTFFLPDAVQELAKEWLHRAAAESETRLAREREAQMERFQRQQPSVDGSGGSYQQQVIDMTNRNRQLGEGVQPTAGTTGGRKRTLEGQTIMAQQPESSVFNSAVERQFFDLAKEALSSYSRDGGQAWAEFMKCLDMYAQEILSRTEMLTFVEPLLGKRNAKLFEEFKRILATAGSTTGPAPPLEDSWYSVPLSEIDFSRCRRCTPSYRALPRDYPAPPCSERNDMEKKVLNDIWVSLPVGSEESYTFRHMRRNTYEEMLFRVEDERFEIDMVIDSNAATLQRLMPFAEEIARLSKEEEVPEELELKPPHEGSGVGGKRFEFTFDKSVLGVIHRNTITRIYGDSGQEMLDLMVKNPVVAIPLVVERLRQKDGEWKKIRQRLNVSWREIAEANYYKSLDHRSLTWRTTDKRATSTRTLVSEIKDRSQNRGKEGKEALRQKLDKAKEEHGTFFEVTMKDTLSENLDLTFLPKPDRLLFTPHLSVLYENNSWAQRDAYRILAFALERGSISPHDKERCHRLWSEFLGPFFSLSNHWMHGPAVTYQEASQSDDKKNVVPPASAVVSEEEEDDSLDDDADMKGVVTEESSPSKASDSTDKDSDDLNDYHPLPTGSTVYTLYGEGVVKEFRKDTRMYVVELPFGTSYLRPSTVLCSLVPAERSKYTDQLRSEDRSRLGRPTDHLVIGNQSLFLVFRLHQILVRRLNIAMSLAHSVGEDRSLCTLVEQLPGLGPKAAARRRYEAYLALVYALLDGGVGGAAEGGKYEDRVRSLLGHGAYELATMDKLISHIWKNLQAVAQDETMWNLIQLYRRHLDAGSFQPESFRREAAFLSDHEPMYAFQWCPIQGEDKGVLHFEYLGVIAEDSDEDVTANDDVEMAEIEVETGNKRPRRQ